MKEQTSATSVPIELFRKYDKPGPRYTSYPTAPIWSGKIGPESYVDVLKEASQKTSEPLSLYCHIPFCQKRCYYCGCNTVITKNCDRVSSYVDQINDEIKRTSNLLGERRTVSQLHFGGGTPTFLNIEQFGSILDCLNDQFVFADNCEISVELDPRVTTIEQLEFLTARGVNRVSIGVQDFDPDVQKASGRVQSYDQVKSVIDNCRKLGIKGINIDLIYGLPKQTPETFAASMDTALTLAPDRVAVYSFAYLPSVKANQQKIDEKDLPDTETKYKLFATAIEKFTAAGYQQIGMDHFALPSDELSLAQSRGQLHRNFMGYTVQTATEMIGFGLSSIGYIGNAFFQNHSKIDGYAQAINGSDFAVYRGMKLSQDDLIRQYVIAALMCNFRLDYKSFKEKFDIEYKEYFSDEHSRLKQFSGDDFYSETDNELLILPMGRTFVRNIAMLYDAYLDSGKTTFSRTV